MNPLVSVIVPTKNSSMLLGVCLDSIKNQTYKKIELIVVDNFSKDNTKEIALKYTDKFFAHGPERSAQVNYGVEQANGEYIYKVDSDFVLDPEVVEQCINKAQEGFDAVVVHNSPDVRVSLIAKIRKFEVDMYKYDITHSSARFVKKTVYLKIGGFNSKITAGEDYDFQNKLNRDGFKTGFVDAEALHLGEPKKLWPHMMKYYDYGKDFVNYQAENSLESKKQLAFGRSVYLKNWEKFITNPIMGSSFIIYTLLKFSFGGMGYTLSKIQNKYKKTNSSLISNKTFKFTFINKFIFFSSYIVYKIKIPIETYNPKWLLFINELYYCSSKILKTLANKNLPFKIKLVKSRFGTFNIRENTLDSIWSSPAFERRDVNMLFLKIDKLVNQNKKILFLDIGADFGTYTINVGNRYKDYSKITIHSFEPSLESYLLLKQNIEENEIQKKVTCHNFGLFNKNEFITLYKNIKDPGSNSVDSNKCTHNLRVETVKVRRLDDIGIDYSNFDVIVLKIDVEGVESLVLEGAKKLIESKNIQKHYLIEDFVNKNIIKYLINTGIKFDTKLTSYNSWWMQT